MSALTLTSAEALQAYEQDFQPDLISELFIGFGIAQHATLHEGVRGNLVLNELILGDLFQKWSTNFNPLAGKIQIVPRTLTTKLVKMDLTIYPQNFSKSYLGQYRRKGAAPDELPFEGYILDKMTKKANSEFEYTGWSGEAIATPPDGTLLQSMVDGYQHIIADEVTASNITPVVTGAITNANAIEKARDVYNSLGPAYKMQEIYCFVSPDHMEKLQINYTDTIGKYTETGAGTFKFDLGNVKFVASAGITGDFMLMTPRWNLHYGYALEGSNLFRFEKEKRGINMMSDLWLGFQFAIVSDNIIAINNQ